MANCPPNPQSGIRRPIIAQYHGRVTGNLNESIRNLQTWTEVYSKDMTPWGNLAARQIQIGRPDLAIVPAMQALALAPKDPWIYVTLARAQMQSGQTDKALATAAGPSRKGSMAGRLTSCWHNWRSLVMTWPPWLRSSRGPTENRLNRT
jgi:hypothetical protein